MIDISIQLHASRWKTLLRPYCKTVRLACSQAVVAVKGKGHWEMAVVLADDAFIHELNRTYRGMDKATNVLAFADGEGSELGDVVLALETVEREAKEQGKRFRDHAAHLLVHGTLHLLGYDHLKDREAKRMEQLEVEILKNLGVGNPYL